MDEFGTLSLEERGWILQARGLEAGRAPVPAGLSNAGRNCACSSNRGPWSLS